MGRLLSSASTVLSKSSRDLVSMLQESVQRMPKSHTVTNLANLHCSFEEGGAGAEGGEIGHAVLSHSPRRTIPRCTSSRPSSCPATAETSSHPLGGGAPL